MGDLIWKMPNSNHSTEYKKKTLIHDFNVANLKVTNQQWYFCRTQSDRGICQQGYKGR